MWISRTWKEKHRKKALKIKINSKINSISPSFNSKINNDWMEIILANESIRPTNIPHTPHTERVSLSDDLRHRISNSNKISNN